MTKHIKNAFLISGLFLFLISLTTCNWVKPGLGESVDLDAPVITVTSHNNGDYVGGSTVQISGTVEDDKGVNRVVMNDGSTDFPTTLSGNNWSITLDTLPYNDGDKEFTFRAVDNTNKTVSLDLFLVVDNNPPTVMITTPDDYGPSVEFNKILVIKGEAADTVRVKNVYISLFDAGNDAALVDNELATGRSSWYYSVNTTLAPDGLYYLLVSAEDWSGNRSSYMYHFKDLLAIAADPGNIPSIEEIDASDHEGQAISASVLAASLDSIRRDIQSGSRISAQINQDSDLPQFSFVSPSGSLNPADNVFASAVRLSGFVSDDDQVNYSTVQMAIWDYADNPMVDTPFVDWMAPVMSSSQWTYEANMPDGEYQVLLQATDIYGVSNQSNPAAFRVSSFAPVLNITSPPQGSYVGPNSIVNISVNVTGLASGGVEVDPNGDSDYSDAIALNDDGGGVYSGSLTAGSDFTVLAGPQFFKLRGGIVGNYGNATLQYTGDVVLPLTTIEFPLEGDFVNGSINFAGTSSDENLISAVYLWIEEDGVTPPPADKTTWLTPDGTDVYNFIYNMDTNTLNPGAHTFHTVAYDAAGNESLVQSTGFIVDQESDRPVISLSNITEGGSANGLGRDASIIGIIEDDDKVDSLTLEIRVDVYNDGSFAGEDLTGDLDTNDANESEAWVPIVGDVDDVRILSWSYDLLNLPQGDHGIQIRVHDVNSDGTSNEGSNPNYAETVATDIVIDYGPPDLSIDTPSNGALFNSNFSISGNASDPNNIIQVEISLDNGGTWTDLYNNVTGAASVPWSYSFTVAGDGSTDGVYLYQVRATDFSGGKTTLDRQLSVDGTAPAVTLAAITEGAVINGTVLMQGGSSDLTANGYTGVIDTVFLDIRLSTDPVPAFPDDYTDLNATYSWSYPFDSTIPGDGNYILRVGARDAAGNESSILSRNFSIDQESDRPVLSFNDIDKDETDGANNVLVGATNLSGIVEDDDGMDPALFAGASIEINLDGAGWIPVSQPPAQAGILVPWKHDISALSEGLHTVRIRARDNQSDGTVGASSISAEYSSNTNWNIEDSADQSGVPFILNLGPPSITVSTPANYSYHNNDVAMSGSSADANGIKYVDISYDNGANFSRIADYSASPISPGAWSDTYTVTGSNDGTVSYIVRATDAYDSTSIFNGQFTVDANVPTASIDQPLNSAIVNGILNIRGTAGDNISLDKVYYELRNKYTDAPTNTILNTSPLFPDDYTQFTGNYSWTEAIDTTVLSDEIYTLRVAATDLAGNPSIVYSIDFTVDQTSDRPLIYFSSLNESGDYYENLVPLAKQVSGYIEDDDLVDVSTIEYKLYDNTGTLLTAITPDWTAISGAPATDRNPATWTHTLGAAVTDGQYQIQLRAADTFDSGSYTVGGFGWKESPLVPLAVDTANPETTFTSPAVNGSYTNVNFTTAGSASDDGGIKTIQLQFGTDPVIDLLTDSGGPYNTTEAWTYDFTVDTGGHGDDGVLDYQLTLTDAYDKQKTFDRYINIDTIGPTINSIGLVNNGSGGNVNGSVLIQALPADSQTQIVALYAQNATSAPSEPTGDPTLEGWSLLGSTSSISYRFNSEDLTDDTDYRTYLLAQDKAGNWSNTTWSTPDNSIGFHTLQSGNTPVVNSDSGNNAVLSSSAYLTGNVTDDDGVDYTSIEISIDGAASVPVSSTSGSNSTSVSFSHDLSGLSERFDPYTIELTASDVGEDFTGTDDDIASVSASSGVFNIYIDNSYPTAAVTQLDNGKTQNPSLTGIYVNDYFKISGTATDGVRVAEVRAKLEGEANFTDYPVTDTDTDADATTPYDTWEWERSSLSLSGNSVVMILEVEDVRGNITPYNFTLLVDKVSPDMVINSTAGTYNGNFTLQGTSSDTVLISGVYLAQGTSLPANAAGGDPVSDVNYVELAGTYSWSSLLDTTTIQAGAVDTDYYFALYAVDGAGNVSPRYDLSIVINQQSDEPQLSITQPLNGGYLESNAKVIGSLSDDDGLASLEIIIDEDQSGAFDNGEIYGPVSQPASISGTSLNFEHDLSGLSDGSYIIQLRAVDTVSGTADDTGYNSVESSVISFDIDTQAPTLVLEEIEVQNPYGGANTIYDSIGGTVSMNGSYVNNDATLLVTASDGSGIATVEADLGSGYTDTVVTNNGDGTFDIDFAVPADLTDGTRNISIRATDTRGKVTSSVLSIVVDSVEPVIAYTSPADITVVDAVEDPSTVPADGANVNGNVLVMGSVSDASSISTLVLLGGKTGTVLTNNGNNISWKTTLNTNSYANNTDAYNSGDNGGTTGIAWNGIQEGDETWTNIWRYPIEVTATDLAGNIHTSTGYLDIDPDSDNPVVTVVAPSNEASVSGTFLVNGTILDDDGTDFVLMNIDLDDDGLFDDSGDTLPLAELSISNDLNDNSLSDDVIDESTGITLAAPSGSWSIAMNASDFTDAKITAAGYTSANPGYLRFRFVPYDINGTPGTEQIVRVYLDTTMPVILGPDPAPDPTPASGTLQKGTVTLEALFKDDKAMNHNGMSISLDGGASYDTIENLGGTITDVAGSDEYDFWYEVSIDIDTTVEVPGGNGILSIILNAVDATNKQASESVQYNVDNDLPTLFWNEDGSGTLQDMPFIGTPPNEVYTFKGPNDPSESDDAYKVLGAAIDSGTISGIDKVNVYFVKDGLFHSPVTASTTTAVSNSNVADSDGALQSIPFTEDVQYVINIDNRIEQGQFDATGGIGDGDGFNESLKAKAGYDEWYSFFDTTKLPDGPVDIYAVAYDEAGNMSYNVISAQIANNPPSVDFVDIGVTTLDAANDKAKKGGTQTFTISASDAEGVTVADFKLIAQEAYPHLADVGPDLDNPVGITSFFYGSQAGAVADFSSRTPASGDDLTASASIDIDTSNATYYTDGNWYLMEAQAKDTDGNIASYQFYLWVFNADGLAPTFTLAAFSQSSVDGLDGHVEEAGDSPHLDNQADLSGTVNVSGTVSDDTQVNSLTVQISYNGSTWVNAGSGTLGSPTGDILIGYTYPFSYQWDTSTISGKAFEDLQIRVQATDGPNTSESSALTVDVVPYITGITGTGFDSGLLTYVRRSAQGRYPISTGATLTLSGYNLPGADANGFSIGDMAGTPGVDYTVLTGTGSSTSMNVALGVTNTSGEMVVTTNSVESLNNSNDNLLNQNQESNFYNSSLTDDRYGVFWDVSGITGTTNITDPAMHPRFGGGGYDWMYVKNGKELYINTGSETKLTEGTGLRGGDFTYNDSGSLMFLYNHNAQFTFVNSTYFYSGGIQWGAIPVLSNFTYTPSWDEAYNWNQNRGIPRLGLGNLSFSGAVPNTAGIGDMAYTYGNQDLNRYANLKIETVGDNTVTRNYVAYFDTGAGESRSIVFYGFKTGTTQASIQTTGDLYYSNEDRANALDPWIPLATDPHDDPNNARGALPWFANIDKFYNVAENFALAPSGNSDNNSNGIATPRGRQEVTTANSIDDSEDFDLAIHAFDADTHHAFIAYYDETSRSLKITVNEGAYSADPAYTAGVWRSAYEVDTLAGADVAMAIDPNGGIHLAYQDVSSGYLKYAFLTYDEGADPDSLDGDESFLRHERVYVDALFGAGAYNSIAIRDFGTGDYRPVILTFSSAYSGTKAPLRLSYPVNAQSGNTFGAGANSSTGAFLGAWETIALPADSNPVGAQTYLFIDSVSNQPYLGYRGSGLEEAELLGILD